MSRAVCQLKGTGVCGSMAYLGDGSGVGESSCGRSEGASMMNAGVCFIKPTPAMIEEEKDLAQRGVVAVFQKSRSPQESRVRAGDSRRAIDSEFHIKDYGLSVVSTYPADFLIKSGPILHEKILQKGSVKGLDFLLSVKPWSRHLYCKKSMFDVKVVIEVSGVPEHAWDTDIVEDLLSPFCSVLSVCRPYYFYPKFIIQALAHGVDAIPAGRSLAIGEPVFSNRLEDACLGTNWPNKVCTYLVVFETKLHEPTDRELDGDSSIDSGYGYDTDREPMGW